MESNRELLNGDTGPRLPSPWRDLGARRGTKTPRGGDTWRTPLPDTSRFATRKVLAPGLLDLDLDGVGFDARGESRVAPRSEWEKRSRPLRGSPREGRAETIVRMG